MEDHYAALGGLSDRFTKAELDAKWKAAQGKYDESLLAYAILSDIDIEVFQEFPEEYSRHFQALGLTGDEADIKKAIRTQFAAAKASLSKSRDAYELLSDPAKRKQYDKQRRKYAKQEEEIWVSSVMDSLSPKKDGEAVQQKSSISALEKAEKAEKEAQKKREVIGRKERYRLERNLKDFERNLAMLSELYELVRSTDMKALVAGMNAYELKSLNDNIEVLIEGFKGMEPHVKYLTRVFDSLKKKPAESSSDSSQLCGGPKIVRNAEENGEERRKSTQHIV